MIDRNLRGEDYLGEICSKYCGLYNHMDCDGCKNNNKYTRAILQESDDLLKIDLYTLEEEHRTLEDTWNEHRIKRIIGKVLLESGLEITEGNELEHICTEIEDWVMKVIIDDIDEFSNVVSKEKHYYDCRMCASRATKDMCENCEAECNFRKANRPDVPFPEAQKNHFANMFGTMLTQSANRQDDINDDNYPYSEDYNG